MNYLADLARSTHLVGIVEPRKGEAPASWLSRLAARQLADPKEVAQYLGIEDARDIDLSFVRVDVERVAGFTRLRVSQVRDLRDVVHAFLQAGALPRLTSDRKPAYSFCHRCLERDEVPYFRISWRFRHQDTCPIHNVALQNTCSRCSRPLVLPADLHAGQAFGMIARCPNCGCPLTKPRPHAAPTVRSDEIIVAHLRTMRLLGLDGSEETLLSLHLLLEYGIEAHCLKNFVDQLCASGADESAVLNVLGVRGQLRDQFKRGRLQPRMRLSFDVSDRLWRMADLLAAIEARTGNPARAKKWFLSPHPRLDGYAPIDLAKTGPGMAFLVMLLRTLRWKP